MVKYEIRWTSRTNQIESSQQFDDEASAISYVKGVRKEFHDAVIYMVETKEVEKISLTC